MQPNGSSQNSQSQDSSGNAKPISSSLYLVVQFQLLNNPSHMPCTGWISRALAHFPCIRWTVQSCSLLRWTGLSNFSVGVKPDDLGLTAFTFWLLTTFGRFSFCNSLSNWYRQTNITWGSFVTCYLCFSFCIHSLLALTCRWSFTHSPTLLWAPGMRCFILILKIFLWMLSGVLLNRLLIFIRLRFNSMNRSTCITSSM